MRLHNSGGLAVLMAVTFFARPAVAQTPAREPAQRTFRFTYAAVITGLTPGAMAHVWLPVPPSNAEQTVQMVERKTPGDAKQQMEPRYQNAMLYFEAPAGTDGTIPLSVSYQVRRSEIRGAGAAPSQQDESRYLQPDALVPIGGKPMELLQGRELPAERTALARVLYDVVDGHMQYRKDKPGWGRGDAVWACDSGFGNCTDFHSLFISLARSEHIPAKFEIGFLLPEARGSGTIGGYHCWAKFQDERGAWIPVDISEANQHPAMKDYDFGNLTENRVMFSAGRDLELAPKQAAGPVNYFIYPYVEVDGRAWPQERIHKGFSFADTTQKPED